MGYGAAVLFTRFYTPYLEVDRTAAVQSASTRSALNPRVQTGVPSVLKIVATSRARELRPLVRRQLNLEQYSMTWPTISVSC